MLTSPDDTHFQFYEEWGVPSRLGPLQLTGAILAVLLLVGNTTGCRQQSATKSTPRAVDTSAIQAALDSLRFNLQSWVLGEDVSSVAEAYTPDAIVSVPGRPPIEGRDSIRAAFQSLSGSVSEFELESTDSQVLSSTHAYQYGIVRLVQDEDRGRNRYTYLALVKRTGPEWKIHRASISADQSLPGGRQRNALDDSSDATVAAVYLGGVGVLPLALFEDGTVRDVSPVTESDTLRQPNIQQILNRHTRYFIDAPPRIYEVDTLQRGEGAGLNPLVGAGNVVSTVSFDPSPVRSSAARQERLAFSTSSTSKDSLRTLLPLSDTTLTSAQRDTIAAHVRTALVQEAATHRKRSEPTTKTSRGISDRTESGSELTMDVTSGDFDGDGSTEYMALADRSFEVVTGTLAEAETDSAKAQKNFEMGCKVGSGEGTIVDAPSDSLARLCVQSHKQVGSVVGRLAEGRWSTVASSLWAGRYGRSLHALNVNGEGAPELLVEIAGSGHVTWKLLRYQKGAFEAVASYGSGS